MIFILKMWGIIKWFVPNATAEEVGYPPGHHNRVLW